MLNLVDVNAEDHEGAYVIEPAVGGCHTEMVALLLKHGADPNVQLKTTETVLHYAAARRDAMQIIKLLVRHGAMINALDKKRQTPLDVAVECKRLENVKLLRRLGALSAAGLPRNAGRRRSGKR
ncbi:MAG TPA: ankyrin repeat domain-containing protein [Planctomycetaceae bacterium]